MPPGDVLDGALAREELLRWAQRSDGKPFTVDLLIEELIALLHRPLDPNLSNDIGIILMSIEPLEQ